MLSIPKTDANWNGQAGSWFPVNRIEGGQKSAMLLCPKCGKAAGLSEKHTISDDGTVHPSVVCPYEGCDFHDHIQLVDWR